MKCGRDCANRVRWYTRDYIRTSCAAFDKMVDQSGDVDESFCKVLESSSFDIRERRQYVLPYVRMPVVSK
jgi:hypothetical protein